MVTSVFADDKVFLAESERIVREFHSVCRSNKLKVNVAQSKVIVF